MKDAGWSVDYVSGAEVMHAIGASRERVAERVILERHRGMIHYFRKHHRAHPVARCARGGTGHAARAADAGRERLAALMPYSLTLALASARVAFALHAARARARGAASARIDLPDARRIHATPTPRFGGLAIAAGVLVVAWVARVLPGPARAARSAPAARAHLRGAARSSRSAWRTTAGAWARG